MVLEKNTGELLKESTPAVGRSRLEVRQPVQDAAVVQVNTMMAWTTVLAGEKQMDSRDI